MISKEKIKYIRSLQRKKNREIHHQFIVEGPKMVRAALEYYQECVTEIYALENCLGEFKKTSVCQQISNKELKKISALKTPHQVLAICDYLPKKSTPSDFIIALDTVQDPGNLGTILRTASWFGITKIWASKETVDVYNPKVIQASMGAVFTIDVEYIDLKEKLKATTLPVYGTRMEGENVFKAQLPKKAILLMGNEGKGIHPDLNTFVDTFLSIPKYGAGESLNVAMATGILVSEFVRE